MLEDNQGVGSHSGSVGISSEQYVSVVFKGTYYAFVILSHLYIAVMLNVHVKHSQTSSSIYP